MSAIIYEVLDMGTGITDADGDIASSGAGIPAFVGVLDKAVKAILRQPRPRENIRPGDVFATNDPFYGGVTHLNDIVLTMPVFVGEDIVAWTANIAHWNDVGGMVPGSMSTDAHEIFQEGLRLPAIKLIDAGQPNRGGDRHHDGQLPPAAFPHRRHVGRHRRGARRRAADRRAVRQIRRRRPSSPHCAASWTTASRRRWRHSRAMPKGRFSLHRRTGRRRAL